MNNKIHQIYHVGRCGSTLLSFLLSNTIDVYCEPEWTVSPILGLDPHKNEKCFYNSVVKFPSFMSCVPNKFEGQKIFLYRPLSQHLYKIKSVNTLWIKNRIEKIDYIYNNFNHHKIINWIPRNDAEKITYLWICSIFRMIDYGDVMWIKTNDFLQNKKETLDKICDHLNLKYVEDFSFCDIDVKKSGLINIDSLNLPIGKINPHNSNIRYVNPSYGIVDNNIALRDSEIKNLITSVEKIFPELGIFLM